LHSIDNWVFFGLSCYEVFWLRFRKGRGKTMMRVQKKPLALRDKRQLARDLKSLGIRVYFYQRQLYFVRTGQPVPNKAPVGKPKGRREERLTSRERREKAQKKSARKKLRRLIKRQAKYLRRHDDESR